MAAFNNNSQISIVRYQSDSDDESLSSESKLRTTSARPKIRAGKNKYLSDKEQLERSMQRNTSLRKLRSLTLDPAINPNKEVGKYVNPGPLFVDLNINR